MKIDYQISYVCNIYLCPYSKKGWICLQYFCDKFTTDVTVFKSKGIAIIDVDFNPILYELPYVSDGDISLTITSIYTEVKPFVI